MAFLDHAQLQPDFVLYFYNFQYFLDFLVSLTFLVSFLKLDYKNHILMAAFP